MESKGSFSEGDSAVLSRFYENTPSWLKPHISTERFIGAMEQMVLSQQTNPVDLVTRETHYELKRQNFKFDEESGQFQELTHEKYCEVRGRVLQALASRAVALIGIVHGDIKLLRTYPFCHLRLDNTSLESYLSER